MWCAYCVKWWRGSACALNHRDWTVSQSIRGIHQLQVAPYFVRVQQLNRDRRVKGRSQTRHTCHRICIGCLWCKDEVLMAGSTSRPLRLHHTHGRQYIKTLTSTPHTWQAVHQDPYVYTTHMAGSTSRPLRLHRTHGRQYIKTLTSTPHTWQAVHQDPYVHTTHGRQYIKTLTSTPHTWQAVHQDPYVHTTHMAGTLLDKSLGCKQCAIL